MKTYSIYRYFQNPKHPRQLIDEGLTLEEAQEYCSDAESRAPKPPQAQKEWQEQQFMGERGSMDMRKNSNK